MMPKVTPLQNHTHSLHIPSLSKCLVPFYFGLDGTDLTPAVPCRSVPLDMVTSRHFVQ